MKICLSFSGGQDSTTCLYALLANQVFDQNGDVVPVTSIWAVTVNYGQRHQAEVEAANRVIRQARHDYSDIDIDHEIVEVPNILCGGPLVGEETLETYSSFQEMVEIIGSRVEKTFVPMRNVLFLTILLNRAIVKGSNTAVIGVSQEDTANYPDCTDRFIRQFTLAARYATRDDNLRIITPLIHLKKSDSVLWALHIRGAYNALSLSHTSYSGERVPVTQDHATVLREQGFREANVPDPKIARLFFEATYSVGDSSIFELPVLKEERYSILKEVADSSTSVEHAMKNLCQRLGAA